LVVYCCEEYFEGFEKLEIDVPYKATFPLLCMCKGNGVRILKRHLHNPLGKEVRHPSVNA
jgi:hypothetical protein